MCKYAFKVTPVDAVWYIDGPKAYYDCVYPTGMRYIFSEVHAVPAGTKVVNDEGLVVTVSSVTNWAEVAAPQSEVETQANVANPAVAGHAIPWMRGNIIVDALAAAGATTALLKADEIMNAVKNKPKTAVATAVTAAVAAVVVANVSFAIAGNVCKAWKKTLGRKFNQSIASGVFEDMPGDDMIKLAFDKMKARFSKKSDSPARQILEKITVPTWAWVKKDCLSA